MSTDLPMTDFVPEDWNHPLFPEVNAAVRNDGTAAVFVTIGNSEMVMGASYQMGLLPDVALDFAYHDAIHQLVNLAYHHYLRYRESVTISKEEEKGTSFDDGAA